MERLTTLFLNLYSLRVPYISRELLRLSLDALRKKYSGLLRVLVPCMLSRRAKVDWMNANNQELAKFVDIYFGTLLSVVLAAKSTIRFRGPRSDHARCTLLSYD
jgi:hypothetical protein